MNRPIVAIAAIILAVAGCGGAASPSSPGATVMSLPSASSALAVSPAPRPSSEASTAIPDELTHVWLGPARDIPALGGPLAVSIIRFRGSLADSAFDFIFGGQGEEALNSRVSVSAPGQIRFTSLNTTGGCHVGDEGTYAWTTPAAGAALTMTKVAETCSPRAEAVVGGWVRAACKDFGCLGDLDVGMHQTAFFEPLGDPTAFTGSWRMRYGLLSYAVPAGWANAVDDPNFYNVVPKDQYATIGDPISLPGIALLPFVAVAAQDEACSLNGEPGIGTGVDAMAARIARIPGLEVGKATPITVAGRPGTMVDVALEKGWTRFCAQDGGVPVLRQGGTATDGTASDRRMTAGERWRLILLEVANGRTMAIIIADARDMSHFDTLVAEAMPIVDSFRFAR